MKSCDKPPYTKREAQGHRNARMKRGVKYLRVYNCPICGAWHLTKLRLR